MICQSWKVMFQAEYSSGSPLRMLVDLRASVENALGRGKAESDPKAKPVAAAKPAVAPAGGKPAAKPAPAKASAAAAGQSGVKPAQAAASKPVAKPVQPSASPEFEISSAPGWDPDSDAQKK